MEWKPKRWRAALLSLLIAPLGLLYVQAGRWASVYFVISLGIQVSALASLLFGATPGVARLGLAGLWWGLNIVAAIHAFHAAAAYEPLRMRRWYSRWYGLLLVPAAWYVGVFLFRAFLYEPYRFPSESMYPTVRAGAVVIASKHGYGDYSSMGVTVLREPPTVEIKRGQLILFREPGREHTVFLKRVIGLPGDHVECRNRRLIINGVEVPTTAAGSDDQYEYVNELFDGAAVRIAHLHGREARECDEVVAPGHYFVLGDNRSNSRDSRYLGTVPRENLVGGAVAVFQPEGQSKGH